MLPARDAVPGTGLPPIQCDTIGKLEGNSVGFSMNNSPCAASGLLCGLEKAGPSHSCALESKTVSVAAALRWREGGRAPGDRQLARVRRAQRGLQLQGAGAQAVKALTTTA